jgi:hypothetical protein
MVLIIRFEGETAVKKVILLLVRNVTISGITAVTTLSSLRAADSAPPRFVTNIPPGYRDLRLISICYEAGSLDSVSAVSGNEAAITPILRKGFHITGRGVRDLHRRETGRTSAIEYCCPGHSQVKASDLVFSHYAP